MDSTQDIIKGYINGGKYQSKSLALSDTEDDFDLDSLVDPLEDSTGFENLKISTMQSPLTPHESPLKVHLDKLRGSPVKTSRMSPVKSQNPAIDESFFSKYDHADLMDTHKYLNTVPEYIPSSKEFERYSLLLASSTDKLMKQLATERKRTRELESKVANYENEKFQAQVTKNDYDLLKRQFADLQKKNEQLLRNYRVYEDDNAKLSRENLLLREKLIKYKKLYEDLRDTRHSLSTEYVQQESHRPHSVPEQSSVERERLIPSQRAVSSDAQSSSQSHPWVPSTNANNVEGAGRTLVAGDHEGHDNLKFLQLILQQFVQLITNPQAKEHVDSNQKERNMTFVTTESSVDSTLSPKATELPNHKHVDLQEDYNRVLAELAHSVERVGLDLKQINSTLKRTPYQADTIRGIPQEPQPRTKKDDYYNSVNKLASNERSVKHGNMPETSILPNTKTEGRNPESNPSDCCCTHNRRECSPCITASSKVSSRPTSHSTTQDSSEGNTHALMGKYMWNKTI